ncbi:hypothetical protein ZWY2020_057028 [Hordeum vulgare]|nr:hypothetical protein ZWY2020_057028 [Hordeum vulgare]
MVAACGRASGQIRPDLAPGGWSAARGAVGGSVVLPMGLDRSCWLRWPTDLPAGVWRVTTECEDTSETAEIIEVEPVVSPIRPSSPRYELPDIPEGYVMEGEVAEDFLACKDSYDLENLLRKWKEKSLNARMNYDPKFATSPIFVTDKDYEFSVDP